VRPAKPLPSVEDEAANQRRSPEDGSPDSDRMANESCDDNRKQEGGIAPENEHGFTAESAHASRLIGSRASPDSVTHRFGSHLGHITSATPLGMRATPVLSSRRTLALQNI
jgi:hypothetical protein